MTMVAAVTTRPRRKWATLAATALLLALLCAYAMKDAEGYRHREVAVDDDDEDDEDDDGEFDFMSSTLAKPSKQPQNEFACEDAGAGECAAPAVVQNVLQRGLVATKPRAKDVIREHDRVATGTTAQTFAGEVLGYVTPWNARGYDLAKQFRAKFAYISPVWFQIREEAPTKKPILTGTHDIDREWVAAVRGSDGNGPTIVPRVMYERNKLASEDVHVIIDLLVSLATKEAFDGFVFEIPIQQGTVDHLLLQVGEALKQADKLLLLVITRSSNQGRLPVTHDLLDKLEPYVHRYTMNAYDYQTPGPNAPYDWIRTTLESFREQDLTKVLMGLPFYGYDNNDAIVGSTYIQQLRDNREIKFRWDATAHECFYQYTSSGDGTRHSVYFPCLQFIQDRLQLFEKHGLAGTAIWELGQGLDYFYDLL